VRARSPHAAHFNPSRRNNSGTEGSECFEEDKKKEEEPPKRECKLINSGIATKSPKSTACTYHEIAREAIPRDRSISSAAEATKKKCNLNGDRIAKPAHPMPIELRSSCSAQQLLPSNPPIIAANHLFEAWSGRRPAIQGGVAKCGLPLQLSMNNCVRESMRPLHRQPSTEHFQGQSERAKLKQCNKQLSWRHCSLLSVPSSSLRAALNITGGSIASPESRYFSFLCEFFEPVFLTIHEAVSKKF